MENETAAKEQEIEHSTMEKSTKVFRGRHGDIDFIVFASSEAAHQYDVCCDCPRYHRHFSLTYNCAVAPSIIIEDVIICINNTEIQFAVLQKEEMVANGSLTIN